METLNPNTISMEMPWNLNNLSLKEFIKYLYESNSFRIVWKQKQLLEF